MPTPLEIELILPTFVSRLEDQPEDVVALRWMGEPKHWRTAIALDPEERISRELLLRWLVKWMADATHEATPEYPLRILAPVTELEAALAEAKKIDRELGQRPNRESTADAFCGFQTIITAAQSQQSQK